MIKVAVYQGERMLACGTLEECAKELGVKRGTVYFYLMPSYRRRIENRGNPNNCRIAVRLDDSEDE